MTLQAALDICDSVTRKDPWSKDPVDVALFTLAREVRRFAAERPVSRLSRTPRVSRLERLLFSLDEPPPVIEPPPFSRKTWISVRSSLPGIGIPVWVHHVMEKGIPFRACRQSDGQFYELCPTMITIPSVVTHWFRPTRPRMTAL